MHFHFVLISLAVLVLVYYIGVAIYIKRNEREVYEVYEEFAQVAMINNSGTPTEWPVYTPQFPAPPRKCCKKKCGGAPLVLPTQPDAVAPGPDAANPAAPKPASVRDPAKPNPPGRTAVTPIAAPPRQVQRELSVVAIPPGARERQYVCAVPQYTVCEVVPAPPISFHAFRFVAIGDGKSFMKRKVANVEDTFRQADMELQPTLLQTEPEWESVPYFEFVKAQTMPYTRIPPATLDVQRNRGCSIVALVRIQNYDLGASDVTLMGMTPQIYALTVNEFRYYIQNNRWMLYIKVWDESDDNTGVTVRSYLDFMNEKDEVSISQNQSKLPAANVQTIAVARPASAQPAGSGAVLSIERAMAAHVAYASVYDRALVDKERNLIFASVAKIIENQPVYSETIEAIVDYDILSIKAFDDPKEQRRIKDKSSRNGFDLQYNVDMNPEKYSFKPFTSIQLTKNDKYYTSQSVYLEMPDGYSMELMFSVDEFSSDVASVIFCYSVIADVSSTPQLIAGVTATDSAKGNLFYVQYFTQQEEKTGRLESSVRISPGEWYHVIVTSESKIFINGVRDTSTRGRAVTNFPAATGRYITIGDYKNPAIDSTTSDYGNTMKGGISLARMYNAPITQTKVDELYSNVKPYVEMKSHLGGVKAKP